MSTYMHLKITVLPVYQNNLEDVYPRLARRLRILMPELVERNPSLYEMARQWDKLLYVTDGTPLRDVLLRHRENIRSLQKSIEENIADWHLAQADQLLYKLEDIFDNIEDELG
jgi:hypothetical protein